MRKRARNHRLLVEWNKDLKAGLLELLIWYNGFYKNEPYYEPQGKREAKKYIHTRGLLQFVPSTFDDSEINKFLKRTWRNRR